MPKEEELIAERIRKLSELREKGINPYPYKFLQTHKASEVLKLYSALEKDQHSQEQVSVAGRIVGLRRMGKASFIQILDRTGKIQIYFKEEELGAERYGLLKLFDTGDWIGVKGIVFKTKTGEVTVRAREFELLCKSLRPLPEKWHRLRDVETRYRQRYLDLISNPEVREVFASRAKIIAAIREVLAKKEFLEVETPVLHSVYGGAAARPFISKLHALEMDVYLRISLELHLKRLIVGGFERVYEIGKCFRNEDIDRFHNPEFTLLEAYQAYADFEDMMELTEDLYLAAAKAIHGKSRIEWQGQEIDLTKPWKKYTMYDAIKRFAGIEVEALKEEELIKKIPNPSLLPEKPERWQLITELFDQLVQPKLVQPCFITHHPKESTPLCKYCRYHPELFVERFEPFICGMEVGNAYSELNDPILQKELLLKQAEQLKKGQVHAHPYDEDFVRAIEVGMPPTGGLGLGIDRMVMLLTNQPSIRDVIFFPFMKA